MFQRDDNTRLHHVSSSANTKIERDVMRQLIWLIFVAYKLARFTTTRFLGGPFRALSRQGSRCFRVWTDTLPTWVEPHHRKTVWLLLHCRHQSSPVRPFSASIPSDRLDASSQSCVPSLLKAVPRVSPKILSSERSLRHIDQLLPGSTIRGPFLSSTSSPRVILLLLV